MYLRPGNLQPLLQNLLLKQNKRPSKTPASSPSRTYFPASRKLPAHSSLKLSLFSSPQRTNPLQFYYFISFPKSTADPVSDHFINNQSRYDELKASPNFLYSLTAAYFLVKLVAKVARANLVPEDGLNQLDAYAINLLLFFVVYRFLYLPEALMIFFT